MSDPDTKIKHSKRRYNDEVKVEKQHRYLKDVGWGREGPYKDFDQPHRLHKRHAFNCGDPHCLFCANPRKMFKEKTIQEKSFEQKELYDD